MGNIYRQTSRSKRRIGKDKIQERRCLFYRGCNNCTFFSVCQMCIARVLQRTIQYFAACQSNQIKSPLVQLEKSSDAGLWARRKVVEREGEGKRWRVVEFNLRDDQWQELMVREGRGREGRTDREWEGGPGRRMKWALDGLASTRLLNNIPPPNKLRGRNLVPAAHRTQSRTPVAMRYARHQTLNDRGN